ncbi:C-type lectin domain family 4 member A-like [Apus apus]|uniref:C-type lectin domain family 4 member A-like n=1 Tax=Apus apus TaxID=8895 RepID=UPI0021F852C8|nr:C-type lectin domain family 4 member A-like [Apus apus]XP_051489602.1 C-type lectin domain family 4 member A-like [Apus apus]
MASEITYAEVKFKNASPAAVAEAPPETKKHEHHPQKYPLCLPWLISLMLLLVCIALIIALLVAPFSRGSDQPTALQQKFKEWQCNSAGLQGKERGWMCCPSGWKLFQKSCYYLSDDKMSWAESEQNCTGMGSHLVVISSKAEQEFLFEELQRASRGENYYIGLSAQKVGQWHWVDKTPFNETAAFWRTREPSNVDDEKCVVIHTRTHQPNNWNDVKCGNQYRVCEAAAVTV